MRSRSKMVLCLVMALSMMLLSFPAQAAELDVSTQTGYEQADGLTYHSAATESGRSRAAIAPYWMYTSHVVHGISIGSGGSSTVASSVQAYSTSYRISGTVTLQRLNGTKWVTEKSWNISGTGSATMSKPYTVSPGKYRVETSVTVNGEPITLYSTIKSYS